MGDRTGIEWTDATWNPLRGCSRVSEGCRNCYAERVAARFCKPGEAYHGVAKVVAPRDSLDRVGGRRNGWTGDVKLVEEHLADPLRWRRPRRIFVNSMSDLFHERVPDEWIDRIFAVMALAPQHTFQVLTKRPERMRTYLSATRGSGNVLSRVIREAQATPKPLRTIYAGGGDLLWPLPNVWLGVSVEHQATADARIPLLLQTPAAVRFVSYEPALGPVDFTRCLPGPGPGERVSALQRWTNGCDSTGLDWIIVGGESGPGARPFDVAWARSTIEACKAAGVPCFVKQLGARPVCSGAWWDLHEPELDGLVDLTRRCTDGDRMRLPLRDRKGGDWSEWPEDLRVREFPTFPEAVRARG